MTLTIGSLFAGIGGFDLGFERAGFRTLWACEIDQKAQAVLRLRFPEAKLHDDVCQIGVHNLEPVNFPDAWNSEGITKEGKRIQMADAPRYRQLGNAVTVNVAHWIANNLVRVYTAAKESADAQP